MEICQAAIRLHEIQINSLRDHINEPEQDQLRKQADAVFLMQQMHEQMMNNNDNGYNSSKNDQNQVQTIIP